MSGHDYNFETSPYRTIGRAEQRERDREDRFLAARDAKLDALRADLVATLAKVQAVHDSGINLVDALYGLELAIGDVDFEKERGA